ncbi:MAG: hypothetical protein M3T56_14775 [Chloroflexota bacterium]|nr:hypothetical protein [Chloroflexota bacterium]
MTSLVRQFPNLRSGAREVMNRGRRAVAAAAEVLRPAKRRRMSAAARAKISAAQKKRWAAQKAGKKR